MLEPRIVSGRSTGREEEKKEGWGGGGGEG